MEGIYSDEEYGGQKRTRFPCLATARYVVTAVVSVLTIVVVVMVIIVALRPEEVIFSIPHQYIEADRQWWVSSNNSLAPAAVGTAVSPSANDDTAAMTTTMGSSFGGGTETTTYSRVQLVYIWVSLTADNPSGRADIYGENVTIRVLDLPNWSSSYSFQGLNEIVTYELQDDRFSLKRQTSHTVGKWILVNNTRVMSNLAKTYGGRTSFPAMVQVTASIVTNKEGKQANKSQNYYCWPVIVGLDDPSGGGYAKSASCRPEKEMDSPFPFSGQPPAPAPTAASRY